MSNSEARTAESPTAAVGCRLHRVREQSLKRLQRKMAEFTQLANSRNETVVHAALSAIDMQAAGVRITVGELGANAEVIAPAPTLRECARIGRLLQLVEGRIRKLPAPGWREHLYVLLTRTSWLCVRSKWSLTWRRRYLFSLALLRSRVGKGIAVERSRQDALAVTLSLLLGEPLGVTASILKRQYFWREYHYSRRMTHLRDDQAGANLLDEFDWPERAEWLSLSGSQQARILVTIHMGDFFGAFKLIGTHSRPDRTVTSMRRERSNDAVHGLVRNAAERHHVARHGIEAPTDIVAALRRGNHTLTALFDLPGAFGETAEVEFFGQPARFVRGPAQMAIMSGAIIVPFVTYEIDGRQRIEMESVIRPEIRSGEPLAKAAARITQRLVTLAEGWIRRHPAQWKYLDHLPGYFSGGGSSLEASLTAKGGISA